MAEKTIGHNLPKVYQTGTHAAIVDGDIVYGIPDEMVYVKNTTERDQFTDKVNIGTFCALYGCGTVWQLDSTRTWVEL